MTVEGVTEANNGSEIRNGELKKLEGLIHNDTQLRGRVNAEYVNGDLF